MGTGKDTGRGGGNRGLKHRHIALLGNVRDLYAVILQGSFKGKGAADKEADHVWGVVRGGVAKRGTVLTVFKDAVGGDIGADISTWK